MSDPLDPGAGALAAPHARTVVLRARVSPAVRIANVSVGAALCAAMGAVLGIGFGGHGALWGAAAGATIALAEGLTRRLRRGAARLESIEVDPAARLAWIVLENGDERTVRAADLARVRVAQEGGDEDVPSAWLVRFERTDGGALSLRARDELEARRVVGELGEALGIEAA